MDLQNGEFQKNNIESYKDPLMEVLDDPSVSFEKRIDLLSKLDLLNTRFGIYKKFINNFESVLGLSGVQSKNISTFEIGSGLGGLSREVYQSAKNKGLDIEVNLFDSQGDVLQVSQKYLQTLGVENSIFLATDEQLKKIPSESFDYVLSLHVIHHIRPEEEAVAAIQEMRRIARRGVFIMDFHRKFGSITFFKIWNLFFGISEDLNSDGIKSMKRAYNPYELIAKINKEDSKFPFHVKGSLLEPYWYIYCDKSIKPT
ncbi:MAG: methyltransferase domain-containing protein [Bdellovibrionales bacterium]|nr:methyltransferase domain-containing protein [Bdellovibrionales bacterium]